LRSTIHTAFRRLSNPPSSKRFGREYPPFKLDQGSDCQKDQFSSMGKPQSLAPTMGVTWPAQAASPPFPPLYSDLPPPCLSHPFHVCGWVGVCVCVFPFARCPPRLPFPSLPFSPLSPFSGLPAGRVLTVVALPHRPRSCTCPPCIVPYVTNPLFCVSSSVSDVSEQF